MTSLIIRNYLHQFQSFGNDFYSSLLQFGESYTNKEETFSKWQLNIVKRKACYRNSCLIALASDKYEYVEGFYVTEVADLPLGHAWNINSETLEIADATSAKYGFKVKERFGVKIDKEILMNFIESEYNGVLSPLEYCHATKQGIFAKK